MDLKLQHAKVKRLQLRISEELFETLTKLAKTYNVTVSELARAILDEHAKNAKAVSNESPME